MPEQTSRKPYFGQLPDLEPPLVAGDDISQPIGVALRLGKDPGLSSAPVEAIAAELCIAAAPDPAMLVPGETSITAMPERVGNQEAGSPCWSSAIAAAARPCVMRPRMLV